MKAAFTHVIQNSSFVDRSADFCLQPLHHVLRTVNGDLSVKIYHIDMHGPNEVEYRETTNKVIHWALTAIFFLPGTAVGAILKGIAHLDPNVTIRLDRIQKKVLPSSLSKLPNEVSWEIYKKLPPETLLQLSELQTNLYSFIHDDSEKMQFLIKQYQRLHFPNMSLPSGNLSLYSLCKMYLHPDIDQGIIDKYFTNKKKYFKIPLYIYDGNKKGDGALKDYQELRRGEIWSLPLAFRLRHLDRNGKITESIAIKYSNRFSYYANGYLFCTYHPEENGGAWTYKEFPQRQYHDDRVTKVYPCTFEKHPLPGSLISVTNRYLKGREYLL